MQLGTLLTQRDAQRRIIAVNLEKFENENLSTSNRRKLLTILTKRVETIRSLNEKIVNHSDVEDLVSELVNSDRPGTKNRQH